MKSNFVISSVMDGTVFPDDNVDVTVLESTITNKVTGETAIMKTFVRENEFVVEVNGVEMKIL